MQPILVAVDLGRSSAAAMDVAIQRASSTGAPLILVHAFSEAPHAAGGAANVLDGEELPYLEAQGDLEQAEAEQLTATWAQTARDAGLDVSIHAELQDAADLVLAAVAQYNPSEVIVGRQGLRKWQRFFLGSVSKTLAERCPVPLTIVPVGAT